jgi:hypothetical protein
LDSQAEDDVEEIGNVEDNVVKEKADEEKKDD